MKTNLQNKSGITLISLVVTIIVMLILAGITISIMSTEKGVLTQAQKSKESTELAQIKEELIEKWYEFEREKAGELYEDSEEIAQEFQKKLKDTTDDKNPQVSYVNNGDIAYEVTFREKELIIYKDGTVEPKTDSEE